MFKNYEKKNFLFIITLCEIFKCILDALNLSNFEL